MMKQKQPGDRSKPHRHKNAPKFQPGILLSWEAFSEAAMREYLDAITDEVVQDLDALEESLRNPN